MKLPRTFDPLLDERRWVIYKTSAVGEKPPLSPHTGGLASSSNPKTWGTYSEAMRAARKFRAEGIGFMLGDGYAGIDLDSCLNSEDISELVMAEVVKKFLT